MSFMQFFKNYYSFPLLTLRKKYGKIKEYSPAPGKAQTMIDSYCGKNNFIKEQEFQIG